MKVTLDTPRILHFVLLLTVTTLGGYALMTRYDFGFLTAFGVSCSVTVQVSDAIRKLFFPDDKDQEQHEEALKQEQKRKRKGGNPKKKKK